MDRHLELATPVALWPHVPEETANSATHGFGLLLSIAGAAALMVAACLYGNAWHVAGCGIYAATLVAVYAASTLSHFVQQSRLRRLFRTLDQAFIYLLIAGTYTPFALVYLRTGWWWLLSALIWSFAIGGFLSKTVWRHRIDRIAVWAYVLLGWLPYLAIEHVAEQLPFEVFWWLLIGGLCYLVGVVFLKLDRKVPYFHAAWHVVVIAGSFCHYMAIFHYVVPLAA
ncbi:MAG: hemolysin III family protein [Planctomycetes bacterium]|nr:hemolysin III family protein [Planctomycetota bacterium]